MPIQVERCNGGEGVLLPMCGKLTGQEVIDYLHQELSEPDQLALRRWVLVDLTDVNDLEVTEGHVQQIAGLGKSVAAITGQNIISIVATEDVLFGMSRMWQAYSKKSSEDWVTMIHRTRPEAEEWLCQQVQETFGMEAVFAGRQGS